MSRKSVDQTREHGRRRPSWLLHIPVIVGAGLIQLASGPALHAQTNLLQNGSFEIGPDPGRFSRHGLGFVGITGWRVTRTGVDYIGTYWSPHAHGNRSVDLNRDANEAGAIAQTFATISGRCYHVRFSLSTDTAVPNQVRKLRVKAAGQSREFSVSSQPGRMVWTSHVWSFVAKANTTTLEFESSSPASYAGPAIDDVRVEGWETSLWRHYYKLTSTATSWSQAEAEAVRLGGHLVTVRTQAQNDWLRTRFRSADLWIGLNDASVEGSFAWSSGESSPYRNWRAGEPNNAGGNEDYTQITASGKWNDLPGDRKLFGIIELGAAKPSPLNGHWYALTPAGTWIDTQFKAIDRRGSLATVRSAAENSWLQSAFPGYNHPKFGKNLWIGFNDVVVPNTFQWISGEPTTFVKWAPGEPNNSGGNEQFTELDPVTGSWNDLSTQSRSGVIEIAPRGESPDIAYDKSTNRYLAVWLDSTSTTTYVVAQALAADGRPLGPPFGLTGASPGIARPKVASIAQRNAFVVTWKHGSTIHARAVRSDMSLSNTVTVAAGEWPDIAGQATTDSDHGVCVWVNDTKKEIWGAKLRLDSAGALSVTRTAKLVSEPFPVRRPAIAKSGGKTGRYVMAYYARTNGPVRDDTLNLAYFDRALTVFDSRPVAKGVQGYPEIDGNGKTWVVAWSPYESGDSDIYCVGVAANAGTNAIGTLTPPVALEAKSNPEREPAVAFTGESAIIAYVESGPSTDDVFYENVDVFGCRTCQPGRQRVFAQPKLQRTPALCARFSAGEQSDETLVIFDQALAASPFRDVYHSVLRVDDGEATDLGNSCGSGGGCNVTSCPRSPNANFAFRLLEARPSSPAVLFASLTNGSFAFCGCTILPPLILWPSGTDSRGRAHVPIPTGIGLTGLELYTQWAVAASGGCGLVFSNALKVKFK